MISIIMTSIWIIRMIMLMIMMIMIIIMMIIIMNIMIRMNMMMAIIMMMIIVMMIMTSITVMMLRPRDDVDHQDDHDAPPPSPLDSYRRYPAGAGRDLFASWDDINIISAFQDRTSPVRKK